MKLKEEVFSKNKEKMLLKQKEFELQKILKQKRKQEKQNRFNDLGIVDISKFGWVQKLAEKWDVSHSQVRRFLKKYKPEIYLKALERKARARW